MDINVVIPFENEQIVKMMEEYKQNKIDEAKNNKYNDDATISYFEGLFKNATQEEMIQFFLHDKLCEYETKLQKENRL